MDIGWHIWEYRERKHLDRCWEHLFNAKLESDQRWIGLFSEISQNKGKENGKERRSK